MTAEPRGNFTGTGTGTSVTVSGIDPPGPQSFVLVAVGLSNTATPVTGVAAGGAARTNLAANPGLDSGVLTGWQSTNPASYPLTLDSSTPIRGAGSAITTRAAVTVAATNLMPNPNIEGGSTLGWNSNNLSAYPLTVDTTAPISGTQSILSTRTSATTNNTVASAFLQAGSGTAGLPIVVGQPVTASLDVKCEQADRRITAYWIWLDGAGGNLSADSTGNTRVQVTAANQVYRIVITSIPPAGAVMARIVVAALANTGNAITGERVWFDNLRVSTGPGTLDATNLHPNPGVESASLSYWNSNNATWYPVSMDSSAPITGQYSIMTTRAATTPNQFPGGITIFGLSTGSTIPCTPGTRIYFACDIKVEQANRRVETYFQWYDAAGVFITNGTRNVYTNLTSGQAVRAKYSEVPPAGAVNCRANFTVSTVDASNAVTGERVWYDNASVGASDLPAFSGRTSPDGTYVYRWTGASNSSTSERWLVSGTEQTDVVYFDGSSSTAGPYTYRWTGTVNASTSQRLSTDATAASINTSGQVPQARLPVTAGQTYTFGIDVKAQQPNRRSRVYFQWFDSGGAIIGDSGTPVVYVPLTDSTTTRLVHSATAPTGAVTAYPITEVYTNSGLANVGEKVWFDNLTIETGATTGSYFSATFAQVAAINSATRRLELWVGYDFGSSAPTSVLVTRAAGTANTAVTVRVVDILGDTPVIPTASTGNTNTSTTADSASLTPAAGDMLFAATVLASTTADSTARTSIGNTYRNNAGAELTNTRVEAAWCRATTTDPTSLAWTLATSAEWAAIQAKWSPPPPPPPTPALLLKGMPTQAADAASPY